MVYNSLNYYGESKVLQYFGNIRHNSTALDAFVEVVKLTKLHWTMRCWIWVLLARFTSMVCNSLKIYGFRPTWSCLIIKVLTTQTKFLEQSGYCTVINYTFNFQTNVFDCFCRVMTQFKLVKHNFLNQTMLYIHLYGFQITAWTASVM